MMKKGETFDKGSVVFEARSLLVWSLGNFETPVS